MKSLRQGELSFYFRREMLRETLGCCYSFALGPFILSCLEAAVSNLCICGGEKQLFESSPVLVIDLGEGWNRSKVLHAAHLHVRHFSAAVFNLGSLSRPAFRGRK